MANPIPWLDPVIKAVFPFSPNNSSSARPVFSAFIVYPLMVGYGIFGQASLPWELGSPVKRLVRIHGTFRRTGHYDFQYLFFRLVFDIPVAHVLTAFQHHHTIPDRENIYQTM